MSDSIIGALIGAGASVAVALINANAQRAKTSPVNPSGPSNAVSNGSQLSVMNAHKKIWRNAILLMLPWIIVTPVLIFSDFAIGNLFIVGGVIILLSFFKPINPVTPVTLSIALGFLTLLMLPIVEYIKNNRNVLQGDLKLTPVIAIILGLAVIAGVVDYYRLKRFQ